MRPFIAALAVALTCAVALRAQETTTKTKIESDKAKTLVYTGCVQTGTQTKTYILQDAIPVKTTSTETTVGTSGLPETTTTTKTSYLLVPSGKIDFLENVGHKVEVAGMIIPAGKITTKTKTEAPGMEKEETKTTESNMPHFQVISVRQLTEPCTPPQPQP